MIQDVIREMDKINVDIMRTSVLQWIDSEKVLVDNKMVYYLGSKDSSQ